jgi:HAD superfamily hydrolase (TIGR01509 family)
MLNRNHWIFDLDGTLTRPIHDFKAIREELGIPLDEGILEFIEQQPDTRRCQLEKELDRIEVGLAQQTRVSPGALDLLFHLHRRGCRLGILTRNLRVSVRISLELIGCSHFFDDQAIVAREDASPKPDPDGVFQLLAHWSAAPEDCLIVGDYLFDLEAGRQAGIATVHYNAKQGQIWPDLTDLCISSFDQLLSGDCQGAEN